VPSPTHNGINFIKRVIKRFITVERNSKINRELEINRRIGINLENIVFAKYY
jgi:hypothetical protein